MSAAVAVVFAAAVATLAPPSAAQAPALRPGAGVACPAGGLQPGPVTTLSATDSVEWPDVVVDGTGRLTAAFHTQDQNEAHSDLWSADVPASTDDPRLIRAGGEDGPGPDFVFPFMSDEKQIRQLGIDADGNQTFAWEDVDEGLEMENVMVATRSPGGAWSEPVSVNREPGFSLFSVHLAVNAEGAAVLTWNRPSNVDNLIAAYRPAGSTSWLEATTLVRGAFFNEVGIDDAGIATVLYETDRGAVRVRRFEPGPGWGSSRKIGSVGKSDGTADLAVSPNGAATVTWEHGTSPPVHRTRRLTADGQWLPVVRRSGGHEVLDNALGIDARGVAVAAWWNNHHDVVVQRSRPDGSWRHRVVLANTQQGPELSRLNVTMNRRGDTLVVWKAKQGDDARLRARYRPAGGAWAPLQRLTPSGVHPDIWTTAIGTDGTAAVAWSRGQRVEARQLAVC